MRAPDPRDGELNMGFCRSSMGLNAAANSRGFWTGFGPRRSVRFCHQPFDAFLQGRDFLATFLDLVSAAFEIGILGHA